MLIFEIPPLMHHAEVKAWEDEILSALSLLFSHSCFYPSLLWQCHMHIMLHFILRVRMILMFMPQPIPTMAIQIIPGIITSIRGNR